MTQIEDKGTITPPGRPQEAYLPRAPIGGVDGRLGPKGRAHPSGGEFHPEREHSLRSAVKLHRNIGMPYASLQREHTQRHLPFAIIDYPQSHPLPRLVRRYQRMAQQHLLLPCPIRRRECADKPHLQPLRIRTEGIGLKPRLLLYAEEIQGKSIVPRWAPVVVALHRPRHRHTAPQLIGPVDLRLLASLSKRSKREPTILKGE